MAMKGNFKLGASLLVLLLNIDVVCQARRGTSRSVERLSVAEAPVGFNCLEKELNQSRPEFKLDVGDVTRKARLLPQPEYPQGAKAARVKGKVRAEVLIRVETGEVVWTRILSGHALLQEATIKAACEARFFSMHGNVRVRGIITYCFGCRKRARTKKSSAYNSYIRESAK